MGPSQHLFIENKQGVKLSTKIDFPNHESHQLALFSHCFTCNKNYKALRNISRILCENGFIVARFDFQGLGQSEGHFSKTSFISNIADLDCVYQYLRQYYVAPQLLLGHSLGGAALIAGLPRWQARCLVTIGTPSDLLHLSKILNPELATLKAQGKVRINIAGRALNIGQALIDDLNNYPYAQAIKKIRIPTMICHSPQDDIVNIQHAGVLFQLIKQKRSFISLDGMDHLLSKELDAVYLGRIISAWARRFCD